MQKNLLWSIFLEKYLTELLKSKPFWPPKKANSNSSFLSIIGGTYTCDCKWNFFLYIALKLLAQWSEVESRHWRIVAIKKATDYRYVRVYFSRWTRIMISFRIFPHLFGVSSVSFYINLIEVVVQKCFSQIDAKIN